MSSGELLTYSFSSAATLSFGMDTNVTNDTNDTKVKSDTNDTNDITDTTDTNDTKVANVKHDKKLAVRLPFPRNIHCQ